ncbi:hypothetical protein NDN08_002822 [Rhodosorus marinus]|uniref:ABC1 atypical kinase-like domain-containing protein n=1 Tax=Rhodosorus marinus TaxID=101924 RepID=A0AAV8UUX3_9RHOD|nr:hypothetical protein NDN08_002822 [Rhodosorus marinus]
MKRVRWRLVGSLVMTGGLFGSNDLIRNDGNGISGFVRLSRSVAVASQVAADYKLNRYRDGDPDVLRNLAHERGARRLLELCEKNGGLYIKFGQHLAQLDHVIPAQYCRTLSSLLAACRPRSISQIREVFRREFGSDIDSCFSSFSEEPIAVASLAQVHSAVRKDSNQKVAVKVQHLGLQESSKADIFTVTSLVSLAHHLFPNFDFRWIAEETAENLPKELDFVLEGENLERCRRNLGDSTEMVTPDVHWDWTTSSVLTMSFEEGTQILMVDKIMGMGLDPKDVSRIISRTFADQIFKHGFLHCDPHGGNILVRRHPERPTKPQLVLLDHGLYKELGDRFRIDYAHLWHGLMTRNESEVQSSAVGLGADGESFRLLAAMLTLKSWNQIVGVDNEVESKLAFDRLEMKHGTDNSEELRGYVEQYFPEISELLSSMPRELLLVMKTNDNLRSIDRALGAPLNTLTITAETISRVIEEEGLSNLDPGDWMSTLQVRSRTLNMHIRIYAFQLLVAYSRLMKAVSSLFSKQKDVSDAAIETPGPLTSPAD